jgi:fructose/tagatose bisphosphate aldolase
MQSIFPFFTVSVYEIKLQIQKSVLETEWKLYSLKTPSHDNVLQIHPGALNHGGYPLVSCCIAAAKHAKVPVTVHLDHGSEETAVIDSLELGFDSVMVDGSHLAFEDNVAFTKKVADIAHAKGMTVEAELGRLSGTEDGLSVEEYEAQFTDLNQVFENSEICYLNSCFCVD